MPPPSDARRPTAAEASPTPADPSPTPADPSSTPAHASPAPVDAGTVHDAAWFDTLFRAHAGAVHRYLARRADRSDAEDLAADVLAIAWRRRDDVPDGAELPWLYRTAGYVLANHRRRGRPIAVGLLPEAPDLDDPALRAVVDDEVRGALARMTARDRQVLLLHAWEGLDGDALALVLGVGRGGADAALSRARARLRTSWAE